MNKLFDQFRVKVSYDCIEINQVNNNSVGLDLGTFKTVDDATQAIDELIAVIASESLDDLISFTVDSYSVIEYHSEDMANHPVYLSCINYLDAIKAG